MCGITGIFRPQGDPRIDRELLHRMNESQHHRGPDAGDLHVEPRVGLGHRRLSIIDVATGQQPLWNEDRSVCVIWLTVTSWVSTALTPPSLSTATTRIVRSAADV